MADEPGALSRPFSKRVVKKLVAVIYETARAGDSLPINESARNRLAELDADKNGFLSRSELEEAILNAKYRVSLKGAASDTKVALKVVNVVDAEDGIQGGQIRLNGGMMESAEAAKNLESGAWTVGAGFFSWTDGVPTLAVQQGSKGAEIALP